MSAYIVGQTKSQMGGLVMHRETIANRTVYVEFSEAPTIEIAGQIADALNTAEGAESRR